MQDALLADLLTFTRDGEWGNGEPTEGFSPALVVRGTDFERVRVGNLDTLPLRYIRSDILERKTIAAGDTLIETAGGTKDQPTGRSVFISASVVGAAKFPLVCASFARFLRPDPNRIDSEFLFWKLQDEYHSRRMLPYHVQHTGVARFQYTQFAGNYSLSLPPLPEQRAIAATLGALDDKIELNRKMNATLEAMARALFRDWFVDFGPTRARMEGAAPYLSPALWPLFPAHIDAQGKPEGWEVSTIGDEVRVVGGSTPSTKDPELWDGSINWATPKDLSTLAAPVLLKTSRSITAAGLAKISSGLLPVGSLLLSSRAPIGYLAIAEVPVAINQGFIGMICDKRMSNVFAWLWTLENMEAILAKANGSTFQEISKGNFRSLPVIVPSAPVLHAFDAIAKPLYERIAKNERESRTLAQTRALLLPRLMSGELQVVEFNSQKAEHA